MPAPLSTWTACKAHAESTFADRSLALLPPSDDIEQGDGDLNAGSAPSAPSGARQCPCGLSRRACIVLLALMLVVVLAVGLGAGLGITRSKDQGAALDASHEFVAAEMLAPEEALQRV